MSLRTVGLFAAATLLVIGNVACTGSSSPTPSAASVASGAPTSSAAPTVASAIVTAAASAPALPSPLSATAAAPSCPTAATVDAALGVTLPEPIGIAGGGSTTLPAGATAVACEYHGATYNVIIELLSNVPASYLSNFTAKFPVPGTSVSGLGDQALAFSQPLSGGLDNEGVVASKGSTIVEITATDTPATLSQIEAFISTLL